MKSTKYVQKDRLSFFVLAVYSQGSLYEKSCHMYKKKGFHRSLWLFTAMAVSWTNVTNCLAKVNDQS